MPGRAHRAAARGGRETSSRSPSVERGYNIYQANCAQCHGANGEGGKGPTLNRQDKLFAHLNPDYLHNVLQVGGRYVCGNPNSIMPIWSNTGNPPGPLNYKQIENLIAFIRAEKGTGPYRVMDPGLFEPVIDPRPARRRRSSGWVDPNYKPEPGATPFPACWTDEFAAPSASPGGSASPSASGSAAPSGDGRSPESALNIAFETKDLKAPAGAPFQIEFDNKDAGIPHNIAIKDAERQRRVHGRDLPGRRRQDVRRPGAPGGRLHLRVHGPPEHDRHHHGRELSHGPDLTPRTAPPSAGGRSAACSMRTAGRGRSSTRWSGSS